MDTKCILLQTGWETTISQWLPISQNELSKILTVLKHTVIKIKTIIKTLHIAIHIHLKFQSCMELNPEVFILSYLTSDVLKRL